MNTGIAEANRLRFAPGGGEVGEHYGMFRCLVLDSACRTKSPKSSKSSRKNRGDWIGGGLSSLVGSHLAICRHLQCV